MLPGRRRSSSRASAFQSSPTHKGRRCPRLIVVAEAWLLMVRSAPGLRIQRCLLQANALPAIAPW
nr:hypothetical protein GCM10020241_30350 [Streptoalloteichus tenebrarius]